MANIICHHEGKYNLYSTIADGFIYESSIDLEQLNYIIDIQLGKTGVSSLPERIERARKNGHSSLTDDSDLDGFLCCNRAGDNEVFLSTSECIKRFLS